MRTIVAAPTITNAVSKASSLSANIATSPVTAYSRSESASWPDACSRMSLIAPGSSGSLPVPSSPTLTSWTFLLGDRNGSPVIAPVTRSMSAPLIVVPRSPIAAWSGPVSSWPSLRLTTIVALASLVCANPCSASSPACMDSYSDGRKSAWSLVVTSDSAGAKDMIAMVIRSQPAITFHGLWTTNLPSRSNIWLSLPKWMRRPQTGRAASLPAAR